MRNSRHASRQYALCALLVFVSSPAWAAALTAPQPGWQLEGTAVMRFLGLKVYEIRLWHAGSGDRAEGPFALELEYAMRFKGRDIAKRSLVEMRGQGLRDERQLARWQTAMAAVFPDVNPGDRLIGVAIPGTEARFYLADRLLGTIADPAFVTAFFNIWLSERTSEPALRARLLGKRE